MSIRFQVRNATLTEWTTLNPILTKGEIAAEIDTGKIKIGDGVSFWSTLPYAVGAKGDKGDIGSKWLSGMVNPTTEGSNGDYYLNTVTCDIFKKENNSWGTPLVNIKGGTGNTGQNGSDGVGVPAGGTTGQILSKIDGTDYNTQWIDNAEIINFTTYTDDYSTDPVGTRLLVKSGTWAWNGTDLNISQTNTANTPTFAMQRDTPMCDIFGKIIIEVDLTIVTDASGLRHAGIFVECDDTTANASGYRVISINNSFSCSKYVNGTESGTATNVNYSLTGMPAGVTKRWKVEHDFKTGIGVLYVDNTVVCRWRDISYGRGRVGFFTYGNNVKYDNLVYKYC